MRPAAALLAAALLASACGQATPSPSASADGPAPAAGPWLTATIRQALPPLETFAWLPAVAITADGVVVTAGAVPAIFPGPLVPPLTGRRISTAGQQTILDWAQRFGLLSGQVDFTGGIAPGAAVGVIRLDVGDGAVELVGDPSRTLQCNDRGDCDAVPGSPEAFGLFWQRLVDLPRILPDELGEEHPWKPAAYALLIGPAPDPQGLPQPPADWPLAEPLATIGDSIGDGIRRCATIDGEAAGVLGPALATANQLTPWIQDPASSAAFGLVVRPLLPEEDACRELLARAS